MSKFIIKLNPVATNACEEIVRVQKDERDEIAFWETISEIFSTHNFRGAVPGCIKKFILPLVNRSVSIAGVADLKMCCLVTDNNIRNRFLKKSTLIHKYTILRIMTYTLVEWTGIAKMRVYIS